MSAYYPHLLDDEEISQISRSQQFAEYLVFLSTQGYHLLFQRQSVLKMLEQPIQDGQFFDESTIKKVHELLGHCLMLPSFSEQQNFLSSLKENDYEIFIRAYFYLVETSIRCNSEAH